MTGTRTTGTTGATIPLHIYVSMPCTYTVVQAGSVTYYRCGSVWYNQVYYQSEVKYVEIAAPKGVEVTSLTDAKTIEANGQNLLYK